MEITGREVGTVGRAVLKISVREWV